MSQFLGTIENHEPGTKEAIETKQQKNPLGRPMIGASFFRHTLQIS
ncbi:hypothetical protein SynRS9915_02177 [Synechococcus sp. RS9915]|nr:hypothetical protein SynRS9915_02177 [Synechococcus sp. RS9915]